MTLDFPPPPTRETTWDARLWELTYCYGTSFKFYRAYLLTSTDGQARVLLNWGRIDTAGQSRVILYDTADEAAADVDRITTSKHRKGYDWENVSAPITPDEQLLRLAGIDVEQPLEGGEFRRRRRTVGAGHLGGKGDGGYVAGLEEGVVVG